VLARPSRLALSTAQIKSNPRAVGQDLPYRKHNIPGGKSVDPCAAAAASRSRRLSSLVRGRLDPTVALEHQFPG
jgi:hypothetical protein